MPVLIVAETGYAEEKLELPARVVADVVNSNDWGKSSPKMFTCPPGRLMRARFTRSYIENWVAMCEANKQSAELDGDIFLGAQGISDVSLESISKERMTSRRATVMARLGYNEDEVIGRPRTFSRVRFWLKVESGAWKVDGHQVCD